MLSNSSRGSYTTPEISCIDCRRLFTERTMLIFWTFPAEGIKLSGLGDVKNEPGIPNGIYFRGNVFGS